MNFYVNFPHKVFSSCETVLYPLIIFLSDHWHLNFTIVTFLKYLQLIFYWEEKCWTCTHTYNFQKGVVVTWLWQTSLARQGSFLGINIKGEVSSRTTDSTDELNEAKLGECVIKLHLLSVKYLTWLQFWQKANWLLCNVMELPWG